MQWATGARRNPLEIPECHALYRVTSQNGCMCFAAQVRSSLIMVTLSHAVSHLPRPTPTTSLHKTAVLRPCRHRKSQKPARPSPVCCQWMPRKIVPPALTGYISYFILRMCWECVV